MPAIDETVSANEGEFFQKAIYANEALQLAVRNRDFAAFERARQFAATLGESFEICNMLLVSPSIKSRRKRLSA